MRETVIKGPLAPSLACPSIRAFSWSRTQTRSQNSSRSLGCSELRSTCCLLQMMWSFSSKTLLILNYRATLHHLIKFCRALLLPLQLLPQWPIDHPSRTLPLMQKLTHLRDALVFQQTLSPPTPEVKQARNSETRASRAPPRSSAWKRLFSIVTKFFIASLKVSASDRSKCSQRYESTLLLACPEAYHIRLPTSPSTTNSCNNDT